ncbi:hypothetical protein BH11MYX1_BH11MYX1_07540 [soil metagenome]
MLASWLVLVLVFWALGWWQVRKVVAVLALLALAKRLAARVARSYVVLFAFLAIIVIGALRRSRLARPGGAWIPRDGSVDPVAQPVQISDRSWIRMMYGGLRASDDRLPILLLPFILLLRWLPEDRDQTSQVPRGNYTLT